MLKIMSLLKINILRHLVCDVTSSPEDGEETPGEGLKTVHVHDTDTSGAMMMSFPVGKKRLKPTRI